MLLEKALILTGGFHSFTEVLRVETPVLPRRALRASLDFTPMRLLDSRCK